MILPRPKGRGIKDLSNGCYSVFERLNFKDIRYLNFPRKIGKGFDSLWADGYYCGSAGHVSQDSVKRYINEQEGKKVFEYDIYECPKELKGQLKIGRWIK